MANCDDSLPLSLAYARVGQRKAGSMRPTKVDWHLLILVAQLIVMLAK